jgi:hypothetical protein
MENGNNQSNQDDAKRLKLLACINELNAQIRKKILGILAHPNTPEIFKNHPVGREEVK